MAGNFAAGGAAINQICIANDLGLKDVRSRALEYPTGDITEEAAMDEHTCARHHGFRHGSGRRRHRPTLHR